MISKANLACLLTTAAVLLSVLSAQFALAAESLIDIEKNVNSYKFGLAQKQLESSVLLAKNPKAMFLYARCLIEVGRFDEAEVQLKRCLKSSPKPDLKEDAEGLIKIVPLMKHDLGNSTKETQLGYTGLGVKKGGVVENVVTGSSASVAGIKPGDRVVEIDGAPAPSDYSALINKIRGPIGTSVKLTVLRDGKKINCVLKRTSSIRQMTAGTSKLEEWINKAQHAR